MRYGFFDSEITGYDEEGMPIFDRAESSDFLALFIQKIITDGVLADPSTCFQVVADTGMTVKVKPGFGIVKGRFAYDSQEECFTLEKAPSSYKRIDRVILRANYLDRCCEIIVRTGTAANTPTAPELIRPASGDYYELSLATILVNSNQTVITQSGITDTRYDNSVCGFVTGVIDQLDFTTLCAQFEAFFADYRTQIKDGYDSYRASMDEFENAAQADFTNWFDTIKHVLDGDIAGNLYNEIVKVRDEIGSVKLHFTNKQVPVSAFKADESYADFPFRAELKLEGALASMVPEVMLDVEDAVGGNFAPVAKSYDGGIYLYAAEKPAKALTIPTILLWRTGAEGSSGGSAAAETYTGSYSVTPSFEAQRLETQGKVMRDNVVTEEIPVAIVSNTAAGNTVIIGG